VRLVRLGLHDFRCYHEATLDLAPGVTLVVGGNGEGKTSLLEAVSWLALGRSFRGAPEASLVRRGAERAVVHGVVEREGRERRIDAELVPGGRSRTVINGTVVPRTRSLADALVVTVFSPDDLRLVQGGPGERRQFLDEVLTTLSPRGERARRDVDKVLRQRGALLRNGLRGSDDATTLDVWDEQLARAGADLVVARRRVLGALGAPVAQAYDDVAGGPSGVALRYEAAWLDPAVAPGDVTGTYEHLLGALREARPREAERRVTLVGPQRDDVAVELAGMDARVEASQGEQRSLALALRLAAHRSLGDHLGAPPVLLLDDVFSELDPSRSEALVAHLPPGQALVTSANVLPPGLRADTRLAVRAGELVPLGVAS
jgi:DNA replication and repair protein RecF